MDKILHDFLVFEKEEQLFDRRYLGVSYWQSTRLNISRKLQKQDVKAIDGPLQVETRFARILKRVKGICLDFVNWFHLKQADILYFDEQLYRNVDGKTVDIYFDYWKFEDKYTIQRCYQCSGITTKGFKGNGIGVTIPDFWHDIVALYRSVFNKMQDINEDQEIVKICKKLNDKFGTDIVAENVIDRVRDYAIIEKVYQRYYLKLLKKIRPRVIFVECHYMMNLFPLYNVAKKCNIPVIELQHGLTCYNDAYNYKEISSIGKALPDYFFSYGEFWKNYVQLPISMKTIAIGNPYLNERWNKYKDIRPDEKSIVFYSDEVTGKALANFVVDFCSRNCHKGYKVYFKFHPIEKDFEIRYPMLVNNSDITILPLQMGVYEAFTMAKHHVSVMSTVLYEAVVFDVKRYIWKVEGMSQYTKPLLDANLAREFETIEEFENSLLEEVNYNKDMIEMMWPKDARKKGNMELADILNKYSIKSEA